ncbi:hypothetical protein B0H10DRAFT_1966450 [Mycena sp. CBHHK59/15]|nr:hypothetical protein B0H10DRAFT_1966450 [Mycena sp. CBHHK59/15]
MKFVPWQSVSGLESPATNLVCLFFLELCFLQCDFTATSSFFNPPFQKAPQRQSSTPGFFFDGGIYVPGLAPDGAVPVSRFFAPLKKTNKLSVPDGTPSVLPSKRRRDSPLSALSGDWDKDLAKRAKTILEHLYEVYKEEFEEDHPEASSSAAPKVHTTSPSKGIFRRAVARAASGSSTVQNELEVYFSGIYPMADDDDDIYG